jgi:hypothetical protein
VRWHWRYTMPQTTLVLTVVVVMIYGIRFGTLPGAALLIGSVYWGGLNIMLLTSFVTRSWFGVWAASGRVRRALSNRTAASPVTD